ncbi:6269_t:CDS:2, partial [Scutellospora calospora]
VGTSISLGFLGLAFIPLCIAAIFYYKRNKNFTASAVSGGIANVIGASNGSYKNKPATYGNESATYRNESAMNLLNKKHPRHILKLL